MISKADNTIHKRKHKAGWRDILILLMIPQLFIGLFSTIVILRYYYKTLVSFYIIVAFILCIGIVFGLLTRPFYKRARGKKFQLTGHLFLSVVFYGFSITAILLSVNFRSSRRYVEAMQIPVTSAYSQRRGGGYWVEADIRDFHKTLSFPEIQGQGMPKIISVSIAEGYFGVTVIKSKNVIE